MKKKKNCSTHTVPFPFPLCSEANAHFHLMALWALLVREAPSKCTASAKDLQLAKPQRDGSSDYIYGHKFLIGNKAERVTFFPSLN